MNRKLGLLLLQAATFSFDGSDHHLEERDYVDANGAVSTGYFDFKRKK